MRFRPYFLFKRGFKGLPPPPIAEQVRDRWTKSICRQSLISILVSCLLSVSQMKYSLSSSSFSGSFLAIYYGMQNKGKDFAECKTAECDFSEYNTAPDTRIRFCRIQNSRIRFCRIQNSRIRFCRI